VQAPGGIDIEISSPGRLEPLGVKRIYASGAAVVNVAPYARRLLDPKPMCDSPAGIFVGPGRAASCYIYSPGLSTEAVMLCGGTEHAPMNTMLSEAPPEVKIAPGERDEIPVISQDRVVPELHFTHNGVSYTDHPFGQRNASGILAAVIDLDTVWRSFTARTRADAGLLERFTVRLRLEQQGFTERIVERHYVIDRSGRRGRRLAWVNRYGAIDYHTFPVVDEFRSGGSRTRMETPAGYRTMATTASRSVRLLSGPCDPMTAEWLSEIFSSPAVWTVDGAEYEKVEVSRGEVVCSPLRPSTVSVVLSPSAANVSRKL
jgi:hypothetical protein